MPLSVDPAYLHERLRYEPETGKLFWRHHPGHNPQWNGRWAGREAFTADDGAGYRCGNLDGSRYYAHRVIWAMVHGVWPVEVDHERHDRARNRIEDMRECNSTGNKRNASRSKRNTSGVTGVHWNKTHGRWVAQIGVGEGRLRHLGTFTDFDEAVRVRKGAEADLDYHPNHGAERCLTR